MFLDAGMMPKAPRTALLFVRVGAGWFSARLGGHVLAVVDWMALADLL